MGYGNREIEKKFVALGELHLVSQSIERALGYPSTVIKDESGDLYWHPHKGMKADFVRLRFMPDGTGQLTTKRADRGSNTNRIEIDVEVVDPHQCEKFLSQILGESCGSVYKQYHVYFLDDKDTSVSVYQVQGDDRVFVEVEAKSVSRVNQLIKQVSCSVSMKLERRSLYQLFISKE
jgi:adenylate cyclase class IV